MNLNLNTRTVTMVFVALVAAGATALFARGWLNAQRASLGSEHNAYQVLVAKTDVPAGRFLRAQDLRWQGWPKGNLAPTYVLQGKRKAEEFDGAVVRHSLVAGQPVTDPMVVRPGEQGFLAAVLEPGMRAVSIQVNAITGISGFVIPGDRVDVVVTHTVPSLDRRTTRHVSETMLQDIRVLAVDQKIEDRNTKASIAKTVTFEVTPKQVEAIGIISKIGSISLSLRPIAREQRPEVAAKPARLSVVSAAVVQSPAASASEVPQGAPADLVDEEDLSPAVVAADIKVEAAAEAMTEDVPQHRTAPGAERSKAGPDTRAGITLDSEVSRVLGHDVRGSGRTVNVVRGSKSEEQKF